MGYLNLTRTKNIHWYIISYIYIYFLSETNQKTTDKNELLVNDSDSYYEQYEYCGSN